MRAGRAGPIITLSVEAHVKRAGLETRLLTDADATPREDESLIRLIIRARRLWNQLRQSTLPELAIAGRQS